METERSDLPCRACRVGGWPVHSFIFLCLSGSFFFLSGSWNTHINTDCRQNLAGIPDLQSTNQSFLLKHPLYIDTRAPWRPLLCFNIHSLDHQLLIELCWECSTALTSFRGATISCATVQLADAPCKTALIQRWPTTVYVCAFTG